VPTADAGNDGRDVPVRRLDGEAIPRQQLEPRGQIAAFPKSRRPLPAVDFLVGLSCHSCVPPFKELMQSGHFAVNNREWKDQFREAYS
jgi:hypothetical protein